MMHLSSSRQQQATAAAAATTADATTTAAEGVLHESNKLLSSKTDYSTLPLPVRTQ
jgi:hypothetical protein